jgi:hypothetical protein
MQQFYSAILVYCKGQFNKCVTKGVLFLQVPIYVAYSDFKCNFNHKSNRTVTTIRVNHSFNHGNIVKC